jgi:hypothetical protein
LLITDRCGEPADGEAVESLDRRQACGLGRAAPGELDVRGVEVATATEIVGS